MIEPVVQNHGLEVVDAHIGKGPGRALVRVVLDTPLGDGAVTVDACAAVSREIGHGLDASDLVESAYMLEVSSPGVDRTLGREKDFERVIGRRVDVHTRGPVSGRKRFRGELLSFDGLAARVRTEAGEFSIPFDRITRARAFYPSEARGRKR